MHAPGNYDENASIISAISPPPAGASVPASSPACPSRAIAICWRTSSSPKTSRSMVAASARSFPETKLLWQNRPWRRHRPDFELHGCTAHHAAGLGDSRCQCAEHRRSRRRLHSRPSHRCEPRHHKYHALRRAVAIILTIQRDRFIMTEDRILKAIAQSWSRSLIAKSLAGFYSTANKPAVTPHRAAARPFPHPRLNSASASSPPSLASQPILSQAPAVS